MVIFMGWLIFLLTFDDTFIDISPNQTTDLGKSAGILPHQAHRAEMSPMPQIMLDRKLGNNQDIWACAL